MSPSQCIKKSFLTCFCFLPATAKLKLQSSRHCPSWKRTALPPRGLTITLQRWLSQTSTCRRWVVSSSQMCGDYKLTQKSQPNFMSSIVGGVLNSLTSEIYHCKRYFGWWRLVLSTILVMNVWIRYSLHFPHYWKWLQLCLLALPSTLSDN